MQWDQEQEYDSDWCDECGEFVEPNHRHDKRPPRLRFGNKATDGRYNRGSARGD